MATIQVPNLDTSPIETAISFETAIPILDEDTCVKGVEALGRELTKNYPDSSSYVVVPVMRGGKVIGDALSQKTGAIQNPIRMNYYDKDGDRMDKPVCILAPDVTRFFDGDTLKHIVFAENVVETQRTYKAAVSLITDMIKEHKKDTSTPTFSMYSLVSKVDPDKQTIVDLVSAFHVPVDIWVHGMGCDYHEKGRDLPSVMGTISPYKTAKGIVPRPYATALL